jgi:hypothetical protein
LIERADSARSSNHEAAPVGKDTQANRTASGAVLDALRRQLVPAPSEELHGREGADHDCREDRLHRFPPAPCL